MVPMLGYGRNEWDRTLERIAHIAPAWRIAARCMRTSRCMLHLPSPFCTHKSPFCTHKPSFCTHTSHRFAHTRGGWFTRSLNGPWAQPSPLHKGKQERERGSNQEGRSTGIERESGGPSKTPRYNPCGHNACMCVCVFACVCVCACVCAIPMLPCYAPQAGDGLGHVRLCSVSGSSCQLHADAAFQQPVACTHAGRTV